MTEHQPLSPTSSLNHHRRPLSLDDNSFSTHDATKDFPCDCLLATLLHHHHIFFIPYHSSVTKYPSSYNHVRKHHFPLRSCFNCFGLLSSQADTLIVRRIGDRNLHFVRRTVVTKRSSSPFSSVITVSRQQQKT